MLYCPYLTGRSLLSRSYIKKLKKILTSPFGRGLYKPAFLVQRRCWNQIHLNGEEGTCVQITSSDWPASREEVPGYFLTPSSSPMGDRETSGIFLVPKWGSQFSYLLSPLRISSFSSHNSSPLLRVGAFSLGPFYSIWQPFSLLLVGISEHRATEGGWMAASERLTDC